MSTIVRPSVATASTFTGTVRAPRFVGTVVTVTYATSVVLNAAAGSTFRITATGPLTISDITGGVDGQIITLKVRASGAARALTIAGSTDSIPSGTVWAGDLQYDAATTDWTLTTGGGGGGGGGTPIVSMTKTEYDALVTPDPATLYVITAE